MKIKLRYDEGFQTLELDLEDVKGQWLSVDLEENLTEEEVQRRVQEAVDVQYNRPEYNCWHRENRHIDPKPKRKKLNGKAGYIQADPDDKAFEIMDYLITTDDAQEHDNNFEYQEVCTRVHGVLVKKPKWADAFIKVRLDGMSVNDYAASIGVKDASIVSKWLKRAEKKLKEAYEKRQI